MNVLITGGAGFIGSHLSDALLKQGETVICVDNFELGRKENLSQAMQNPNFHLLEGDAAEEPFLESILKKYAIDMVYHMAANSDIRKSAAAPGIDEKNTFSTTYSVLEAMRNAGVKRLFFASTSAVYGEKTGLRLSEDAGGLSPVSYYGAAKLASEAFISAYSHMNGMEVTIFRFPNVIGPRLTHGVIYDFISKLKKDPGRLQILGNGQQEKPYLYVHDLVEAIIRYSPKGKKGVEIFNVGPESSTTVKEIADMICSRMGLDKVEYCFTGGRQGWRGDVPSFRYDLSKIHSQGWHSSRTSNEAVLETLSHVLPEGGICRP